VVGVSDVEPSRRGTFDEFGLIETNTADGAFRSWTSYVDDTPIATLRPFRRPIPNVKLAPTTQVRLSRFAYLRRAEHAMILTSPLTGMDMEFHDPRAGMMLAALNFDISAEHLATKTNLPVALTTVFLNQLAAMSAAFPVAQDRDRAAALGNLAQWALDLGLPGSWNTSGLRATLLNLPWDDIPDSAELILELHHDGTGRVDVSITVDTPNDHPVLSDVKGQEFDITTDGPVRMGTFDRVRTLQTGNDPAAWTQRALDASVGSNRITVARNPILSSLVQTLGPPAFIGDVERREGTRLIFLVSTRKELQEAGETLRAGGVPASVIQRLTFLEPVVDEPLSMRLAVDVLSESILPTVAFEVFLTARSTELMPGVLDALGVSGVVLDEVLDVVRREPELRDLMLAPGVVTDTQQVVGMHVKLSFDAAGQVTAKTYVALSNTPLSTAGRTEEDRLVPSTWEFHDLLFHSQTRQGRVRNRIGGSARFSVVPQETIPITPPPPGDVALPIIDVAVAVKGDQPFGEVMRARESDRDWTGPEITQSALAELLARVQEVIQREASLGGGEVQVFDGAPYPSGGAIYETDIVVVAHRVEGIDQGAYLYRRGSRSLQPLIGSAVDVDTLLLGAAESCGTGVVKPQALLVLAARFPDLAVKYEGIAYALMVKHVGVLMAAISYSATAMGLGAVPIGTGDSDVFASATGLDYYRRGSIGEIAVSAPPVSV
jgi:SagB-type dehydrogenase family enzyme